MISADLSTALPEILLALYALIALMFGAYGGQDKTAPALMWVTAAVFALLALWLSTITGSRTAFSGMFIDDTFARFAKVAILLSAGAVLLIGQDYMNRRGILRFEYPVLIAIAVLGMMVMVSAGDLMSLYMGLELQSLTLYVVAALRRDSEKSTEAGLKYFVLGALSSGLLLYGASLVYGFSGTTNFAGILTTVNDGLLPMGLLFGLIFLLAGLAFKISAVPFHMWTPDVYEGAPTPITAFFATAPKIAAMALIARVVEGAFGNAPQEWGQVLALLSVLSMFVGSIAAIGQRNIKRLMAYSSITHMGFALLGLASGTQFGVQATLLYMVIYATTNVGAFAFILSMEKDGRPVTNIDALRMYSKREPLKALAVLVLMFSLGGVPPMVGFFAKFYVLKAVIDANMQWLALLGVLASVIASFYYIRIVYYMYFGEDREDLDTGTMSPVGWIFLMGSAAAMMLGVINLFGVDTLAQAAAATLVH
ncbi:NADH-quinone oxidoreductase subunit NuoN [Thioclava sp. BHET1]|nr:NADH-quinone oxidoreductase subunit NuoN [Thioclava sp. BHET1]